MNAPSFDDCEKTSSYLRLCSLKSLFEWIFADIFLYISNFVDFFCSLFSFLICLFDFFFLIYFLCTLVAFLMHFSVKLLYLYRKKIGQNSIYSLEVLRVFSI
jgi:hypothetical protein